MIIIFTINRYHLPQTHLFFHLLTCIKLPHKTNLTFRQILETLQRRIFDHKLNRWLFKTRLNDIKSISKTNSILLPQNKSTLLLRHNQQPFNSLQLIFINLLAKIKLLKFLSNFQGLPAPLGLQAHEGLEILGDVGLVGLTSEILGFGRDLNNLASLCGLIVIKLEGIIFVYFIF